MRLSADVGYQYQYGGGAIPILATPTVFRYPGCPTSGTIRAPSPGTTSIAAIFSRSLRAEVDLTERITAYVTVRSA